MEKESDSISAYPLQWPAGWPRTESDSRKYGRFGTKNRGSNNWSSSTDITISQALGRINSEIESLDGPGSSWNRIDPATVVISTNLKVRRSDGLPASSQRAPEDPGAAVYFNMDGKNQSIPCDAYTNVAQNLAGIAATLAALRTLERHGSGIMEKAFTGFEALPNPDKTTWRDVLGYPEGNDLAEVKVIYRAKIRESHPDNGGDASAAAAINVAWDQAQEELKS